MEDISVGPITRANMKVIERQLYHSDSCTRKELQSAIQVLVEGRISESISERTIQSLIKKLNDWYDGKNRISMKRAIDNRGPIYTLENKIHLRFPEVISDCSEADRDMLRLLLQIAYLHNMPVSKLAKKISKNSEILDAIDIQEEPSQQFGEFFISLFDAKINRKVMTICYEQKDKTKVEKIISPLMLKCYNNRWYLIAHAHEINSFEWSIFPLDRIVRVNDYDHKKKKISFYEIKISRIKEYYSKVIGFDVPWDKIKGNSKENPKRAQNPKDLITTPISIIFSNPQTFKYILNNPIHISQTANTRDLIIYLNVVENDSLYKKLMVIGNDIETISPVSVKERLFKEVSDIFNNLSKRNQNAATEQ